MIKQHVVWKREVEHHFCKQNLSVWLFIPASIAYHLCHNETMSFTQPVTILLSTNIVPRLHAYTHETYLKMALEDQQQRVCIHCYYSLV